MTVVISGTSGYIADFSNATVASRQAFQTSTVNGSTGIYALPNGTSTAASWQATNAADPTNASKILIATNGSTDCQLVSGINGTGTYLPLTFYTSGAEKMRLDTAGNLGLGVTPSAWGTLKPIQVLNASFSGYANRAYMGANWYYDAALGEKYIASDYATQYLQVSGQHRWLTAASGTAGNVITFTQAMTLDASGNLLVGTTSAAQSSSNGVKLISTGVVYAVAANGPDGFSFYNTTASAYRFYVNSAGTINATSTTITGISDQRLKENIRDLDDGLNVVLALKPRKFDWKDGKGAGTKNARGFIAQEFEQILPDMIEEWRDPAPEGEEPYKAVNANLIPTLVKAIQEQQAIIQQLQSDVEALKAQK